MQGVDHYENFPVASWLCPPALRAPIAAIYLFARTADDIADEGNAPAEQRIAHLAMYRTALVQCWSRSTLDTDTPWPEVFGPLAVQSRAHGLPLSPLMDLLDAFEQDVRFTASGQRYASTEELLDYCRRSANPVGRLLLHLYGVSAPSALQQSDAICSALQLINFWQDLSVDLSRQRHYLPGDALAEHGLTPEQLTPTHDSTEARALMKRLCDDARERMLTGAPLALVLPGRLGWELRLVVQGGLLILDKLAQDQHRSWQRRPALRITDLPTLLWRAWRMPATLPRYHAPASPTR